MRLWSWLSGVKKSPVLPFFTARYHRRVNCLGLPTLKIAIMIALLLTMMLVGPATAKPILRALRQIRENSAGLEILQMAFSIKMVETVLAIISVAMVTTVYAFLIRRGPLMSTTAMYPRRSIEANIGRLLSLGWPDSSNETRSSIIDTREESNEKLGSHTATATSIAPKSPDSIRLFYLGKMDTDDHSGRVAKGVVQCAASISAPKQLSRLWLTSGSPLTKDIVQLLVWEWASLWLMLLMLAATLIYNGFFTNELSIDSYPRLTVMLIYATAYISHAFYVWNLCSSFFTNVASGASWSLLERAMFAVGETKKLHQHKPGESFEFRSIEKASSEYIPTTFHAMFKHETHLAGLQRNINPESEHEETAVDDEKEEEDDPRDVRSALATIAAAQISERNAATESLRKALDRVVSNAMVMMGVTLSTGFSSWTAQQSTENTPNNFDSTLIGSLALLASLSLGAATMFTSALHLSIMDSSYRTIVSLKETKINSHAVDHYKKRRSQQTPLSFTRGTVPLSKVRFSDIFTANRWQNLFGVLFLGPAFGLLPTKSDHERTSADVDFDLTVKVRDKKVLLTTRATGQHAKGKNGVNVEAINVCYIDNETYTV